MPGAGGRLGRVLRVQLDGCGVESVDCGVCFCLDDCVRVGERASEVRACCVIHATTTATAATAPTASLPPVSPTQTIAAPIWTDGGQEEIDAADLI